MICGPLVLGTLGSGAGCVGLGVGVGSTCTLGSFVVVGGVGVDLPFSVGQVNISLNLWMAFIWAFPGASWGH